MQKKLELLQYILQKYILQKSLDMAQPKKNLAGIPLRSLFWLRHVQRLLQYCVFSVDFEISKIVGPSLVQLWGTPFAHQ